jgi:Mn-dependent DtxR family transcriptional regulator
LKSQIALEILLLADGSKSTTEISKVTKKSVATISTYTNRLKRMNLIRVLENGHLKRNIKGVKVNFELGL